MESIQKTMTFERAKCVGRLLYAIGYMLNVAICCPTESKWNETKCSRQIAFENAQQKLVYWLRPLGVASLHIGIDSSRLDLTWLFSRLVGQCYVNLVHFSFSYIYFFCFFFLLVFYRTHNTLNLLHKNPNNSTNIYGPSQQKSIQFSLQPPRTRYSRLFRPPYARLFRSASMWIRLTGLAALHSKDASCADRTR